MKKTGFLLILLLLLPAVKAAWADVHIISKATRVYRERETNHPQELWLTAGKSYRKSGFYAYIEREDLGVEWTLDLRKKTYRERKLEPAAKPPPSREDFYTLGFSHDPEFDWTIKKSGEIKNINGLPCRCFMAEGDSDFSEIQSIYWICTKADTPGGTEFNRFMLKQLAEDKERAALFKIMQKFKNSIPVLQEDIIENPIARTISMKRELSKLEISQPPPHIYDLPEGFTNPEKKQSQEEAGHAR